MHAPIQKRCFPIKNRHFPLNIRHVPFKIVISMEKQQLVESLRKTPRQSALSSAEELTHISAENPSCWTDACLTSGRLQDKVR